MLGPRCSPLLKGTTEKESEKPLPGKSCRDDGLYFRRVWSVEAIIRAVEPGRGLAAFRLNPALLNLRKVFERIRRKRL